MQQPNNFSFSPKLFVVFLIIFGLAMTYIRVKNHDDTKPIFETSFINAPEPTPVISLPKELNNGAWFWASPSEIDEQEFTKLMQFAKEKNIKTVYLFLEEYIYIAENPEIKDKKLELTKLEYKLNKLLAIADKNNVKIEALGGDVNWADSSHEYIPFDLLDYVISFNTNVANPIKLSGIQFDVEYYNNKSFKNNKAKSSIEFLTLVQKLNKKISDYNTNSTNQDESLKIGFAIPYWLNNEKAVVPKVTYNAKEATVYAHMLDILEENSYLVLMSYRDEVFGKGGSIEISRDSLDFANATSGKTKVYVGLETEYNDNEKITYFGANRASVNKAAAEIVTEFQANPTFGGIALHTLTSYFKMEAEVK